VHLNVVIDIGPDGQYVASVLGHPGAYARAGTKNEAERLAIALYLEDVARKFRRRHLNTGSVFPLYISRTDLDFGWCASCHHYRVEHKVVADIEASTVVFELCTKEKCDCRMFALLLTR
jgi:predicted RNase H-like HicB family nuclease